MKVLPVAGLLVILNILVFLLHVFALQFLDLVHVVQVEHPALLPFCTSRLQFPLHLQKTRNLLQLRFYLPVHFRDLTISLSKRPSRLMMLRLVASAQLALKMQVKLNRFRFLGLCIVSA